MKMKSLNPAKNYEAIGEVEVSTFRDIVIAVEKAHKAATIWAETPLGKRAEYVRKLKELLLENKEEVARLITQEVGKPIRESRDDIDLVWFTGSTKVGQEIYKKAGQKFIKAILELGGSSPAVVLADADIDSAVEEIFIARFLNCGQVCTAIKRLFVAEQIFDEFVKKLKARVEKVKIGDPMDESTDMGSLVSKKQLNLLEKQVIDAKEKGAKIIIGGKRPDGLSGAYYLPTLLTNIKKNMRVFKEEVFGPVLPIMPFKNIEEAIELANDTIYGLSAEIYTKDNKLAQEITRKIKAGMVAINTDSYFKPECPFGGYKKSGIGREMGEYGLQEFTQIKHIHLKK